MSFNILLIQIVLFSCVFSLLRSPRLPRGWLLVSSGILVVLGLLFMQVPQWAGWISGALWLVLMVIPLVGFLRVNRLLHQEQYRQARWWASWVRWLHPMDGWMEYPDLLWGLELGQRGQLEEARQVLQRYSAKANARIANTKPGNTKPGNAKTGNAKPGNGKTTPARAAVAERMATALLFRFEAKWQELLVWMQQNWTEDAIFQDVTIATSYLRALGETGDLNGLVQGVEKFQLKFERSNDAISLNLVRMYALAFCGRVEFVRLLFQGVLSAYTPDMRRFWLATAEWAAGNVAEARATLISLQPKADRATQNAIAWRLANPVNLPQRELRAASSRLLAQIELTIQHETRYSGRGNQSKPFVTYTLIGLNCLVFLLELYSGGSENLDTLYRLGALVPEQVLAGEGWRILTATFLHYGVVHLTANMLGLWALGTFVEARLGVFKFLIAYFCCGMGSMAAIGVVALWTKVPDLVGVGASGAIMGILGVMAAILLQGWRREKARIAARRLRLVGLIVALQTLSDVFTPEVSLVGHLSGLILGFLLGSVLFRVGKTDRTLTQAYSDHKPSGDDR